MKTLLVHNAEGMAVTIRSVKDDYELQENESFIEEGESIERDDNHTGQHLIEYEAQQYERDRKAEYPQWSEQLDYIYHNGVEAWKNDIIKPIKDRHPKPE